MLPLSLAIDAVTLLFQLLWGGTTIIATHDK